MRTGKYSSGRNLTSVSCLSRQSSKFPRFRGQRSRETNNFRSIAGNKISAEALQVRRKMREAIKGLRREAWIGCLPPASAGGGRFCFEVGPDMVENDLKKPFIAKSGHDLGYDISLVLVAQQSSAAFRPTGRPASFWETY